MKLCGQGRWSISVTFMRTTHERTAMRCETCGADVLIERHEISAGETFIGISGWCARQYRPACHVAGISLTRRAHRD